MLGLKPLEKALELLLMQKKKVFYRTTLTTLSTRFNVGSVDNVAVKRKIKWNTNTYLSHTKG